MTDVMEILDIAEKDHLAIRGGGKPGLGMPYHIFHTMKNGNGAALHRVDSTIMYRPSSEDGTILNVHIVEDAAVSGAFAVKEAADFRHSMPFDYEAMVDGVCVDSESEVLDRLKTDIYFPNTRAFMRDCGSPETLTVSGASIVPKMGPRKGTVPGATVCAERYFDVLTGGDVEDAMDQATSLHRIAKPEAL